jgi:phosphoribosylanthranilate isomerase
MVRIKFCGMTNLADCQKAIDLEVDFIGFVLYKKSTRYVAPTAVKEMVARTSEKTRTVGVFVEETDENISKVMGFCGLDLCQIIGKSRLKTRITTYRVRKELPEIDPEDNGLILFDSYSDGFGGSGKPFDLSLLAGSPLLGRSFVAGGISEVNVTSALRLDPFGIDLVSSIEVFPGKKDHEKMESFIRTARNYQPSDNSLTGD